MVFQKGTKKCDYVFQIGNEMIDIVHVQDRGTQRQFSKNICPEDDLRSRIMPTSTI